MLNFRYIRDKLLLADKVRSYIGDHTPVGSLKKSFIDNVFREKVHPIEGSILYCSLWGVEHTGIYIGDNQIIELLGTGEVCNAIPAMFIDGTNAISIYVACEGTDPLGGKPIAKRAERMVGTMRDYRFLTNNCHQFVAGCITGEFENSTNYFALVESTIKKKMNNGKSINWRVWDF